MAKLLCLALLVLGASAARLRSKPADKKPHLVANRTLAPFRGHSEKGIEEATLFLKVNGTEYPCGRPSKTKAFDMYRENLLAGLCSIPTSNGFNCLAWLAVSPRHAAHTHSLSSMPLERSRGVDRA